MADDSEIAFWSRYARASNLLNLYIVVIDLVYVVATWHSGPHRLALLVINLLALAGITAATAARPEAKIAGSRHRDLIFGSWCLAGTVIVTVAVWADGGLNSPLVWLFPLSVMFTATVHRPRLVVWSGVAGTVGFLGIGATDGALTAAPATVLVRAAYIVALTYAASATAHFRWDHLTAQAQLRDRLSSLADHDGLTGLLNHRAFHEQLAAELELAGRSAAPLSVLLIDLDWFKTINDQHGHLVGDLVLRETAARLSSCTRDGDLVARVGGEEFAVVLPGAGPEEARAIAERIRETIAEMTDPVHITASIGVSSAGPDGLATPALVERADGALYEAKQRGRNRVCWLRVA